MTCFFCKGTLVEGETNYVVNYKDGVIVVRHVPCMECQQCGETSFSNEVMQKLEEIVTPLRNAIAEVTVVRYPAAS